MTYKRHADNVANFLHLDYALFVQKIPMTTHEKDNFMKEMLDY